MEKGICPICGKENSCGMLKGISHELCWCTKAKFEKEMFDFIPEKYQGISCICLNCIMEDYQEKKRFKNSYDMHIHTTFSDGTFTPYEIIKKAKEKGLRGIAITDHDTVKGLKEGIQAGIDLDMDIIQGIEFSSSLNDEDVHILGYFVDFENLVFQEQIEILNKKRTERNIKILQNLEKYKMRITMEELEKEAKGDIISKLHIANVLRNKGYVYTKEEAFKSYLGKNGVAYEGHGNFTPQKAVEILNENGAVAVLAHPQIYSKDINKIEKLVKELIPLGLQGIEVEYPNLSENEKQKYKDICKKYDLAICGGSDFHGGNRENIELGQEGISYSQMLDLKSRIKIKN